MEWKTSGVSDGPPLSLCRWTSALFRLLFELQKMISTTVQ